MQNERRKGDVLSSPKRKNLVIVGRNIWDDPKKRMETSFCAHITRELCHAGRDVQVVSTSEIDLGVSNNELFLRLPDGKVYRKGDPDLPKWALCYVVPERIVFVLEQLGIACFSSYEMLMMMSDKMLAAATFSDFFAQPDTLFFGSDKTVDALAEDENSYPFMLKGVSGCGGENVGKVDDFAEMIDFADEHENNTELIMMQQLMPSADDLRVYILGDEILGCVVRYPKEGIWKANLEFGPKREEYKLNADEERLIRSAMELLPKRRRGLYSFDFLFDEDRELVLCETNCNLGTNALDAIGLGDDIFLRYVSYIRREMQKEQN